MKDRQDMKEIQKHLARQRRQIEAAKCKQLPEWEDYGIKLKDSREEII